MVARWSLAAASAGCGWIGRSSESLAQAQRFSIAISNRNVAEDQRTLRVARGSAVELVFSADEPAELHLHGYDKLIGVAPGQVVTLRFDATIAGRFPLEAHGFGSGQGSSRRRASHVVLLYLEVLPP